jgi:ribosomal-protein-alanine N-acetyltransferase
LAFCLKESNLLIGAIGLHVNKEEQVAEIGYWIGREFWGQGYASEATEEILRLGFEKLNLH